MWFNSKISDKAFTNKHQFVFHNNFEANQTRGFEINIILVYSHSIKENLLKIENDRKKMLKLLKSENPNGFEIIKLDINPFTSLQDIMVDVPDNIIDCFIFCLNHNTNVFGNSRLILGKDYLKRNQIHITCSKMGIHFRH